MMGYAVALNGKTLVTDPDTGQRRTPEKAIQVAMVAAGSDHVIAFLRTDVASPGTRGCVTLIEQAGIPLTIIEGTGRR
jgi:hypothetical protein